MALKFIDGMSYTLLTNKHKYGRELKCMFREAIENALDQAIPLSFSRADIAYFVSRYSPAL